MADRLNNLLEQVFGIPKESITDDDGPSIIKAWDSLGHINLILALESEFSINLSPDDAAEMLSVKLIKVTLRKKGIQSV